MKYQTVGISGQSASGKTYFLNMLMSMLSKDCYSYIDLDGYHYHGRQERMNLNEFPEDIKANNTEKIIEDIRKIKKGERIEIPTYNHKEGEFGAKKEVEPKPIIFVEGLHTTLLNDIACEKLIDFTIHINPSIDLQKAWKVHRDVLERGYDFNTVMSEIKGRKSFDKKYIQPQIKKADIVIKVNKSNWQIQHFVLLAKTCNVSNSTGFDEMYHVEKVVLFDNNYYQLSKRKQFHKVIYSLDLIKLLNHSQKPIKYSTNNTIEDIVQITLGLILLFKINNNG